MSDVSQIGLNRIVGCPFARVLRNTVAVIVVCLVLVGVGAPAMAQPVGTNTLRNQTGLVLGRVSVVLTSARTIVALFLVGSLMWGIAMWASGRPALKPLFTTLIALMCLFGLQIIIGVFTPSSPPGSNFIPEDALRYDVH